jgi:hypothetical protein
MKKCDYCGKETSELYSFKEKRICSECRNVHEPHSVKMETKLRDLQVKMHKKWLEDDDLS